MFNPQQKIEHLRRYGFTGDLNEIAKCYAGQPFDHQDANYQKLLQVSRDLCHEFTALSPKLNDPQTKTAAEQRKAEILDILFPGHGMIFGGGDDLQAVIGMVDVGNMVYINIRNHFHNNALVNLQDYVAIASNVSIGADLPATGTAPAQPTTVGQNTWLCSGVQIDAGCQVGAKAVLGMGSVVTAESRIADETLAFGVPCQSYRTITPDYVSKKLERPFAWSSDEIRFLLAHARRLGVKEDLREYVQMLNGEEYNCLMPGVAALHDLAHRLCSEYNDPATSRQRQDLILEMLFPIHGKNLTIGKDLYTDIIGSVKMGDNVQIGDRITLAGNVAIGNNVQIGNNVTLQCIGHRVYWKGRLLGFTSTGNPIEICTSQAIKIHDDLKIGHGVKVQPGASVHRDLAENELLRR